MNDANQNMLSALQRELGTLETVCAALKAEALALSEGDVSSIEASILEKEAALASHQNMMTQRPLASEELAGDPTASDAAGDTAAETIGAIISKIDKLLAELEPEAVLILGDTNSALAAIPAKRRKIPIFHMEAGNRCFDLRVPEEINRRIVDHISDVNLTYSQIARDYLLREGLPPDQVICTGSPMREVLERCEPLAAKSQVLEVLQLKPEAYFLVSAHREENVDAPERLTALLKLLNVLAERYDMPVIFSTHPRTRARINALDILLDDRIRFMEPFGFPDFIALQRHAKVTLSDSGTITEESSILNFPALNIREAQERPEGFEEAAVMLTGFNEARVMSAIEILATQPRGTDDRLTPMVQDYRAQNISDKVVRIILSYIDFINLRVWRKSV